jgi:hypothetical protein
MASKSKYRDTTTFIHVMAELVRAAQYRGLTTYQDIAVIMGLPVTGSNMGRETGRILGDISRAEVLAGRPMLSSIAVGIRGKPGPGFYGLAREIGRVARGESEAVFWQRERDAVYATWKRPLPRKQRTAS